MGDNPSVDAITPPTPLSMTLNYKRLTKIPGTDIESEWVFVTPEMAREFLEYNIGNRNKRDKHIANLVSDIENNRFILTHQGMAFDIDGILVDGQHRCMAIIRANEGQWVLVTRGLSKKARGVMDIQGKRNPADFMVTKNKNSYSATVKAMLSIEQCGFQFSVGQVRYAMQTVTSAAIQEAWGRWPDLEVVVPKAMKASKNVNGCGPTALAVAALLYPDTADEFLQGLIDMSGLSVGDARLALLRYGVGSKGSIQAAPALFLGVKAAKAFAEGRRMNIIKTSNVETIKVYPLKLTPVEVVPSVEAAIS